MQKILITDIDDTLLDWTKSFDLFVRDKLNYTGESLCTSKARLWDALNVSKEEVPTLMMEHTKLDRFANLEYLKDANILNNYKSNFYKVIALTSCGDTDEIIVKRNKNIATLFPIIDEIIYLDFMELKEDKLIQLVDMYKDYEIFMIDDNIYDVSSAINLGINAMVYKTNFHDCGTLPMVDNFTDFIEKIVK